LHRKRVQGRGMPSPRFVFAGKFVGLIEALRIGARSTVSGRCEAFASNACRQPLPCAG
jgi:hypothetical protein